MSHSAEPWTREGQSIRSSGVPGMDGLTVQIAIVCFGRGDPEADARRIVACVNACSGISTDALEAGSLENVVRQLVAAQSFASSVSSDSLHDPDTWVLHKGMAGLIRDRCYTALRELGRLP